MASVIVKQEKIGNGTYVEILFTNGAAAGEQEVANLPNKCTVTRYTTKFVSGTATTVDPALGRAAGFASGDFDEVGSDITGAPAARVGTVANNEVWLPSGSLFVQPRPDAGADNSIRVELHIVDGWESAQ